MLIIRTIADLNAYVESLHNKGLSVGLVPTMGALHEGHLSLVKRAVADNDAVLVSVFVNPVQFNNPADLATYPRKEEDDFRMLSEAGVSAVFAPSVEEIYPGGPDAAPRKTYDLGTAAEVMEGKMRPGHFQGVACIVEKLFRMCRPTRAYFGEKDFQQIAVIRKMAEICGFNINIIDCPIRREDDGLAMSSRNVRLTPEQRAIAPAIHKTLVESLEYAASHTVAETEKFVTDKINAYPDMEVEYYQIVNSADMQPITDWNQVSAPNVPVGCVTVYCGKVRLIDNIKYMSAK